MMLLVDMGNHSIKWATFMQGQFSPQQSIIYPRYHLERLLTQAWGLLSVPIQGIWVSNVAGPEKAKPITHWIKTHWDLSPTFIKTSNYECGVKNGYDYPEQLGVDRWLALIGARHLEKGKLCVVDCGTAITLDVLSAEGYHQGGLIIPGVMTMHKALLSDTYALTCLSQKRHRHNENNTFLAHDTHTGIKLGTLYAVIGLLDSVINHLEKQEEPFTLILTGGSVPALKSFLKRPYQFIPELVLQGLVTVVNQSL